jgi:HD-GYP domain-containing protein (c-di-GMP phosphodiesterase class II)
MGDLVSQLVREISAEGLDSRGGLFAKFAKLARTGTDFQRHPLHVASLTVMMTVGLGIHDQRTLIEVGLASLLHDVGLTQLPMSVIGESHKYRELGTVSRALLKLHPQGSIDLLRNRGIQVSKLMDAMITQHHEEYNGQGYPLGLVGAAVHPLAQVLLVADALDDLLSVSDAESSIEERVRDLFARFSGEDTVEPGLLKKLRAMILDA